MRAGALRHRFALQAPQDTPDGAGGITRTWTPIASFWGALIPLSARERVTGRGVEMAATHRVILRHRSAIDGTQRLALGARIFAIHSLSDPQERGQWLELLVEETRP